MAKIAIIGTGAWGTALANVLLENKHEVLMYGIDQNELNDLRKQTNTKYFGNTKLIKKPDVITNNMNDINSFEPTFLLIALPSKFIEQTLKVLVNKINHKVYVINVAKGLNPSNNETLSSLIKSIAKPILKSLITLIGPSYATEVFNKKHTIVNVVSRNIGSARIASLLFNNNYFRCVVIKDEKGAELIAALKNVMAIGLGITLQLHTSINTRAAMLAQGAKEISKLVKIYGGKLTTIFQFCGIGDIYLTCTDPQSRNFSFGQSIAKIGIDKTIKQNKKTVEGYNTCKIIYEIIQKKKMNSPFFIQVYKVLFEKADPNKFVEQTMKLIFE